MYSTIELFIPSPLGYNFQSSNCTANIDRKIPMAKYIKQPKLKLRRCNHVQDNGDAPSIMPVTNK